MTAKQIASQIPANAAVSGTVRHPRGGYTVTYARPVEGGQVGDWEMILFDAQVSKGTAERVRRLHRNLTRKATI